VGDKAEEGFVPDPATLVLGCEGLRGRCSGNDPRPRSEDPRESLQRGWRESSTKKMSRPQSSGMRASTKRKYCVREALPRDGVDLNEEDVLWTIFVPSGEEVLQRGGVQESRRPATPTSPRNCNVTTAALRQPHAKHSKSPQWCKPVKAGHVEQLELDGLRKASWPT
jgi:hypothetical protein